MVALLGLYFKTYVIEWKEGDVMNVKILNKISMFALKYKVFIHFWDIYESGYKNMQHLIRKVHFDFFKIYQFLNW